MRAVICHADLLGCKWRPMTVLDVLDLPGDGLGLEARLSGSELSSDDAVLW